MKEGTHFPFDAKEIATLAASIVEQELRDENHGIMPDDLYLPQDFDDPKQYSDAMITLMHGIERAMQQIVEATYPKMRITKYRISSDEQRKSIAWRVFELLKMAPPGGVDDETLLPIEYTALELPLEYGTGGYINLDHPRVLPLASENKQGEYNSLKQRIDELLYERGTLLEEFFDVTTRQERENAASRIEMCFQELDLLRRDFSAFCEKYGYDNTLVPNPAEELSEVEKAFQWNYIHHHEEALESFAPTPSETALLHYMPRNFQQTEWYLFQFTFDPIEEIEAMGCDPEQVFSEDMRRMTERQFERKMLIAYHARSELMLAKRGRSGLNARDINIIKQSLCNLRKEIEECARKLESRSLAPTEEPTEEGKLITYDISEVGTLADSADHILKKAHLQGGDPKVLDLIAQIGYILHQCFSEAAKTRRDYDFNDHEKAEIIQSYRHDAIRKLKSIQKKLRAIDADNDALDRADSIVAEALQHLSQY